MFMERESINVMKYKKIIYDNKQQKADYFSLSTLQYFIIGNDIGVDP